MKIQNRQGDYITEEKSRITIKKDGGLNHYDILENKGKLRPEGYCVLNYIYVNDGHEEAFEDRFLNRKSNLASSEGFTALRVLKPCDDAFYVILTLWEDHHSFKNWQRSSQYQNTHKKRGTTIGLDNQVIERERSYNIGFEVI